MPASMPAPTTARTRRRRARRNQSTGVARRSHSAMGWVWVMRADAFAAWRRGWRPHPHPALSRRREGGLGRAPYRLGAAPRRIDLFRIGSDLVGGRVAEGVFPGGEVGGA